MFETGIRQFRMVMSMLWGRTISPRNVENLVEDAIKTLQEFGEPGNDVLQLLEGPFSDPAARQEFQARALQRTMRNLKRFSPYYQKLFSSIDIEPADLTISNMLQIPLTSKQSLQDHQQEFITTNSHPHITTRTTGTTGHPTEIWLSRYEMELWPALSALSGLLRNELSPQDCVQINVSSRATASIQLNISVFRLVGARVHVLGIIPPDESLDQLLNSGIGAPTHLVTYPSYLAQLIQHARRRNLSPSDFRLRDIVCSGEVLSDALIHAAQEIFGVVTVNDVFGMTEVVPVSGRICRHNHLHHDLNTGFVEVIDPQTRQPAAPGAVGTIIITPYYPYRECMPVFRYDTRDIVQRLPDEPLSCELAGVPATSRILGKWQQISLANGRIVSPRDIVEIIEALPSQPFPARFSLQTTHNQIELVLPEQTFKGITQEEVSMRFLTAGIPLTISCQTISDTDLPQIRSLRSDLIETTFTTRKS